MAGASKIPALKKKANLKINTNSSMRSGTANSQTMNLATVAAVSTSALKRPLSNRSVSFADSKQPELYNVDAWRGAAEPKPFEQTRLELGEDESVFSTDQSSIMLTPLNKVRVSRTRMLATNSNSNSGSDMESDLLGPRQVPRVEMRAF
jgi:hypothetical protein